MCLADVHVTHFSFFRNAYLQVGGSVKTWHWRWFEIDQLYLSYYRSHHHSQPIRRIPLSHVLSVMYAFALRVGYCNSFHCMHSGIFKRHDAIFNFMSLMICRADPDDLKKLHVQLRDRSALKIFLCSILNSTFFFG